MFDELYEVTVKVEVMRNTGDGEPLSAERFWEVLHEGNSIQYRGGAELFRGHITNSFNPNRGGSFFSCHYHMP